MAVIPPAPWRGQHAEVERTPEGCVIVRGPHGAFYQPHGAAHWLPFETPEELEQKLLRKPVRPAVAATDWSWE